MMKVVRAAAAALLMLTLAACAGNSPAATIASGSAAQAQVAAPAGSVAAPVTGQAATAGAGAPASTVQEPQAAAPPAAVAGQPAAAQPAPTPTIYSSRPAPATAALTSACVRPGGVQTLTVTTEPNFYLVFDTQYSDGGDGRQYGGIETAGNTGSSGVYRRTWIVAANAPAGLATVYIATGANGASAMRQATFRVGC